MSETETKLQGLMREVFNLPDLVITREMTASDLPEWDSLAHLNLIIAVEKEFSIHFNLDELESMQNVGMLVDVVAGRTAAA